MRPSFPHTWGGSARHEPFVLIVLLLFQPVRPKEADGLSSSRDHLNEDQATIAAVKQGAIMGALAKNSGNIASKTFPLEDELGVQQ
uniref:Putative secreted protein n=1 Tax=Ixodes ricinus TaxID=34613 RepID=A0A6B0U9P0_IXORI